MGKDYPKFDAVVLVGAQGWPRLELALKYLMKERGPKTLIVFGRGDDAYTEYDRLGYVPLKERKVDVISFGGDILLSEGMLPCITTCILNLLLVQGRRNVLLGGEDGLVRVMESLRDSISKDYDRYGRICLYTVPLPQEVE